MSRHVQDDGFLQEQQMLISEPLYIADVTIGQGVLVWQLTFIFIAQVNHDIVSSFSFFIVKFHYYDCI